MIDPSHMNPHDPRYSPSYQSIGTAMASAEPYGRACPLCYQKMGWNVIEFDRWSCTSLEHDRIVVGPPARRK